MRKLRVAVIGAGNVMPSLISETTGTVLATVRLAEGFAADLPYVSLWYPDDIFALATRFEGFEPYPGGQYTSLKLVRARGSLR